MKRSGAEWSSSIHQHITSLGGVPRDQLGPSRGPRRRLRETGELSWSLGPVTASVHPCIDVRRRVALICGLCCGLHPCPSISTRPPRADCGVNNIGVLESVFVFSIKATKSIILVMRGLEQGRPSILDIKRGRTGCTTPPMRPFHPAEPGPKAGRLSRGPSRCPLCPAASLASAGTQATCPCFPPFCKYLLSSSHCREGRMGRRCQEGNQTRQERGTQRAKEREGGSEQGTQT